jgi:hypothetical protein
MIKTRQKGEISTGLMVGIAFLLFILFGLGGFMLSVVGVKDTFSRVQNGISTSYEDYKTVHTAHVLKIQGMAQVPKMAAGHIKEIITAALEGRYGDKGSQAVFQAIQEQNPNVPPDLYQNLSKEMSGGQEDIKAAARKVNDQKNIAYNQLDATYSGFVLKSLYDYPTKNIGYEGGKDDYKVAVSELTNEAVKTGIDKGVNILN